MRGAKLPAFRSTSFPLDWALDWGLDWELYSATGNPFEELLLNCGGLVGDYGQAGRPVLDRKVVEFKSSATSRYDLGSDPVTVLGACTIESVWRMESIADTPSDLYYIHTVDTLGYRLMYYANVSSGVGFRVNDTNTGFIPAINTWYHSKVTFNSLGEAISLEIDGSEVWSGIAAAYATTDTLFYIGNRNSKTTPINGQVAQTKITLANGDIFAEWGMHGTGLDSSGNGRDLTLINNPSFIVDNSAELADYDVVNTIGYSKAVQGDGATGHITLDETSLQITSLRVKFIAPATPSLFPYIAGWRSSVDDIRFHITHSNSGVIIAYIGTESFNFSGVSVGDELDIQINVNGEVFSNGVLVASLSPITPISDVAAYLLTQSNNGVANSTKSTAILLQAWVNGEEVDIFDTSKHVGTVNELVIPPSSNNDGLDALGNPLDVRGSAYPALPVPVGSKGLGFNGVDQYGLIEDMPDTLPITFDAVIKPKLAGVAYIYTLTNPQDSNGNYRGIDITVTPTNNVAVRFGDGGGLAPQNRRSYVTDGALNLNQWYKIKCVINSFDDVSISIDDFDQQLTISGTASTFTNLSTTHGICTSSQNITGELDVAHLSINGVSIPFNNNSLYDLASDGSVVNYINNPTQVDQDVYHAELEDGFYKAVLGDGATGAIDSGVGAQSIVSMKARFVWADVLLNGGYVFGRQAGAFYVQCRSTTIRFYCGSSTIYVTGSPVAGENTVELLSNGDAFLNGELIGNTGGVFTPVADDSPYFLARRNSNGSVGAPSNAILLQAWVNGQEIDIHDTNNHVGTIETHRLVGYSDLTNPAIPNGHNDANTGFNLTHLTEGGNTPPAITATGQDVQNYRFGDSLTNPLFKRVLSPVGEDRHSLFSEVLSGACLEKSSSFFSTP